MVDSKAAIALICLVIQNSGLAIMMRYTLFAKSDGERYITSTAVLFAELLKLIISATLCFIIDAKSNYKSFFSLLYTEFISNRGDWIKLSIPSVLYTVQNSLQYFSMTMLSAPVFQVLYQMKIITTGKDLPLTFNFTLHLIVYHSYIMLQLIIKYPTYHIFIHSCIFCDIIISSPKQFAVVINSGFSRRSCAGTVIPNSRHFGGKQVE